MSIGKSVHPFVCLRCGRRPSRRRYNPYRFGRRNVAYIDTTRACAFCSGLVVCSFPGTMSRPWKLAR